MATHPQHQEHQEEEDEEEDSVKKTMKLMESYLGLSLSVLLAFLPKNSVSFVADLQSQIRELSWKLQQAEEQIRQMKSRRKEDSKANARVVEIFASHRNAWQAEEKRMLQQMDAAGEEIAHLRAKILLLEKEEGESKARIQDLEREVGERDNFMISFMSAAKSGGEIDHQHCEFEEEQRRDMLEPLSDVVSNGGGFNSDFLASSASKFWAERPSFWQDVQYESLESVYNTKHFVARESPWKVDGESTGVPSKLKSLEEELMKLEKVCKSDLLKVPSSMRKQVKRYQALTGKIDDLCRRMQSSDPCEPTVSTEFRTQRQTEFLLEAFRLQQHASENGQKLMGLQTEIGKSYYGDELGSQAKVTTKRSLDSIRNNLKEIQRNLEIWLARIIGDLEGILARDGASRVREYYISRYPFVQ